MDKIQEQILTNQRTIMSSLLLMIEPYSSEGHRCSLGDRIIETENFVDPITKKDPCCDMKEDASCEEDGK